MHPALADVFAEKVQRLQEALLADLRLQASGIIRSLVELIVVTPDDEGKCATVRVEGDLAGNPRVCGGRTQPSPSLNGTRWQFLR
jgi:hypothetical protein